MRTRRVILFVGGLPRPTAVGAAFGTRLEGTGEGDFAITVGCDLSVGYRADDRDGIRLVCLEPVAAQTMTPKAVCVLGR